MVHVLADYSNPQTMKVGGLFKQQPITILIDMGSTNSFLNSKVAARITLQIEYCNKFNVKVTDDGFLSNEVGNSPGVRRELAKGIGSLLGWRKGVCQKKTETHRKIIRVSRKACRERLTGKSPRADG
ncbi:hypothetical protein B296_00002618 [Ensete ventricosum]|uniref:Uncharacterized protein n=1 Tax=Ensete ventricosum TaxID=4639 RepID=A0A427ATB2_ENSVE|nr:hypothetical protein B296_00002618 [Ensete ventricosum]